MEAIKNDLVEGFQEYTHPSHFMEVRFQEPQKKTKIRTELTPPTFPIFFLHISECFSFLCRNIGMESFFLFLPSTP